MWDISLQVYYDYMLKYFLKDIFLQVISSASFYILTVATRKFKFTYGLAMHLLTLDSTDLDHHTEYFANTKSTKQF